MKKIVISLLIVAFAISAEAQNVELIVMKAIGLGKAKNYTGAIALLRKHEAAFAKANELSDMYGQLSWYYLFTKEFNLSEQTVRKALKIDGTQTWVKTNLAHALLFQGKIAEAEDIYNELANTIYYNKETFAATLLDDFDKFEKTDIVPSNCRTDFENIKTGINKSKEAIEFFKQFEQLCIEGKFDEAIFVLHPYIFNLPEPHAQWAMNMITEKGNECYNLGDYAQAEKYFLEAENIREQVLKKEHSHYSALLKKL